MSTLVDFSIVPMDKGESISPYVARALAVIAASGLDYRLGPMGTSIEGEWPEVRAVIDRCFKALQTDCRRIYMTVRVDYRREGGSRMAKKVAVVEAQMGAKRQD